MLSSVSSTVVNMRSIIKDIFGEEMHQKRQLSISYPAAGLFRSNSLLLPYMGSGMAKARGVDKKHATKQIDRLLSNPKLDIWHLSSQRVPYISLVQKKKCSYLSIERVLSGIHSIYSA